MNRDLGYSIQILESSYVRCNDVKSFFLEDVKTVYESTNPCRNKFHLIDLSLIPNIDIIL